MWTLHSEEENCYLDRSRKLSSAHDFDTQSIYGFDVMPGQLTKDRIYESVESKLFKFKLHFFSNNSYSRSKYAIPTNFTKDYLQSKYFRSSTSEQKSNSKYFNKQSSTDENSSTKEMV